MPQLSFVVPLYNEQDNFETLISRLVALMNELTVSSEVVLVNDGSSDNTAQLMNELGLTDTRFQCVFLSKRHGHQLALTAGIKLARGTKALMILDGDLQDPPELVKAFLLKLEDGFDVVYGVRKNRKESFLKKQAYWFYYRIMKNIANIEMPLDSGDFSLISRKVADYINSMPEQNRYVRGMRSWIGFRQTGVAYERAPRHAGETKYSWKKLFELAYSGIFNFSNFPVKFITRIGIFSILLSLFYIAAILIYKFILHGEVPTGFTTLIMAIVLFSGVQLISLGVIGEYVLRIYQQVQNRPMFIIDKVIKDKQTIDGQELLP